MSGPSDAKLRLTAARWWLAISRNVIVKAYPQHARGVRAPVTCPRTPTFISPLGQRRL
ncbi:MAG: hypothetical protein M3280_06555 [Actinomycetota bacterium]|nr:hypothetical protein [Actinomycetota bacterium]